MFIVFLFFSLFLALSLVLVNSGGVEGPGGGC